MGDAPGAMPPLAGEGDGRGVGGGGSEGDALFGEPVDGFGGGFGDLADDVLTAQSNSGGEGVLDVVFGGIVRIQSGGHSALGAGRRRMFGGALG